MYRNLFLFIAEEHSIDVDTPHLLYPSSDGCLDFFQFGAITILGTFT